MYIIYIIYVYIYTLHILCVCYRLPQMQSRLRWLWTNYLGSASARLSTLPWMKSHGLKRLDTNTTLARGKVKAAMRGIGCCLMLLFWVVVMWTNSLTWFCTSAVMFRTCTVSALHKRKLWEGMWVHHLLLGLGGPAVGHSWACASALHKRKLWESMRAHHILLGLGGPDVGHSWACASALHKQKLWESMSPHHLLLALGGHLYTSQIFSVHRGTRGFQL